MENADTTNMCPPHANALMSSTSATESTNLPGRMPTCCSTTFHAGSRCARSMSVGCLAPSKRMNNSRCTGRENNTIPKRNSPIAKCVNGTANNSAQGIHNSATAPSHTGNSARTGANAVTAEYSTLRLDEVTSSFNHHVNYRRQNKGDRYVVRGYSRCRGVVTRRDGQCRGTRCPRFHGRPFIDARNCRSVRCSRLSC